MGSIPIIRSTEYPHRSNRWGYNFYTYTQYAINHEITISYVNDSTLDIYTINRNYAAYEVSDAGGDFTLYDEQDRPPRMTRRR